MRPTETEEAEVHEANVNERRTRELCAHERNGLRCMLSKGHPREHAAFTTGEAVTWR